MATKRVLFSLVLAIGGLAFLFILIQPAASHPGFSPAPAPDAPAAATAVISWEYDQLKPGVAYGNQAGKYIVVWEDHHWGYGQDWDIYARYIYSNGTPTSSAFALSWLGENDRFAPQVAYNSQQYEFLVVWEVEYTSGNADHDIHARRVSPNGSLYEEIVIHNPASLQANPALAYDSENNRYLVVWEEDGGDIYGKVIDSSGGGISEVLVLASGTDSQLSPAVAYSPRDEMYLVVWQHRIYATENTDLRARWVSADGSFPSRDFVISNASYDQLHPRLVYNPHTNQFLIVWQDHRDGAGGYADIYGQFVSWDSGLAGSAFIISSAVNKHQIQPDVTCDAFTGEYMVTWEYVYDQANDDYDIHRRRVSMNGELPETHQIVSQSGVRETRPAIASNGYLSFLLTWEDSRNTAMLVDIYSDIANLHLLSGKVFAGNTGDESSPLPGVNLSLYASNNLEQMGDLVGSATTNSEGWYGILAPIGYDYYNLVASDLPWYTSMGASSVGGVVVNANHIRYTGPLEGKTISGNKYWDMLSDLEMLQLTLDPAVSTPDQAVTFFATLLNNGPGAFSNIPIYFTQGETPFGMIELGSLAAGETTLITYTHTFTETGYYHLSAVVNLYGELVERNYGNNQANADLNVVFEAGPGWSKPDLAVADLNFSPRRPAPGSPLQVSALLSNPSRMDVITATVGLLVDGLIKNSQVIEDLPAGVEKQVIFNLTTPSSGRHSYAMLIDPHMKLEEKSRANNQAMDWLRVSGSPSPLPDLEIAKLDFGGIPASAGDSLVITPTVCNEGYAAAINLPMAVLVDGREIFRQVIANLQPDTCTNISVEWRNISEGEHMFTVIADPEDILPDDSIFGRVTYGAVVPGAQYQAPPAISPIHWEAIGPITIDNNAYVGRIDSIDISKQSSNRIVVGAPAGGVWLSDYAGSDWKVIADRLKSPGFPVVLFDPTDDNILYAASGSSLWGGGSGLYKSVDGGATWTVFADTWIGSGYGGLILRYTSPSVLTILAGTDTGVWVWQGSKTITQTQQAQWTHAWTNTTPGKGSSVMDMVVTSEATPRLYIAVFEDTVYRVNANTPTAAWTRLNESWPAEVRTIKLGNSPASPDLIYAAVEPPGKCNPNDDRSALLDIYTRRTSHSTWTKISRPTDESHLCGNTYNAYIKVHPTNANIVYIGGVKGWRSNDGGATFPYTIPFVHDDYKAMTFDPANSSIAWFVTDGGAYRCDTNTGNMNCSGRNYNLAVTMFYDFALTYNNPDRILGGTQDNGNILTTGGLAWQKLSYGGDGKYCAFDPANANTMVAQYQYADSTARSTDGGIKFNLINSGLPKAKDYSGDSFLKMHPTNGNIMLVTAVKVYRTTNAGGQWADIGPTNLASGEQVRRVDIDAVNNRYYAGTTSGRVFATRGDSLSWTAIYTQGYGSRVEGILVDSIDPNQVYVTFHGQSDRRVIRLTHSGGWPGSWTAENRTGNFPINILMGGGMGDATRGLFKDPTADILYVGTTKGVYQGQIQNSQWQWFPDTCGLPLTYISDLEYANGILRAATFGRSAYKRTLSNPVADPHDATTRNDTLATRTQLGTMPRPQSWFMPSIYLENLNFDLLNDMDFFTAHLPTPQADDCLPLGDPRLNNDKCYQCQLSARVQAPDNPLPLEMRLYDASGYPIKNLESSSYLGFSLHRPWDIFPSGQFTFSLRSPNNCRSSYSLVVNFQKWYCEMEAPNLLTDPPLFKKIIPEVEDFTWMFPSNPLMINKGFTGQAPATLEEERVIFEWENQGDFKSTFHIHGFGNLNATLYDANNNPLASSAPLIQSNQPSAANNLEELSVDNLPAGWYALGFSQADFPTWFDVQFWLPRLYLPVLYR